MKMNGEYTKSASPDNERSGGLNKRKEEGKKEVGKQTGHHKNPSGGMVLGKQCQGA